VRSERREGLPEALLGLPEVGCLAAESGPVDFAESGEPFTIMVPEVAVEALVGIDAQKLAYDLDAQNLGVGKLRGRSALAQPSLLFEPVVYQAEDGNDEGVKIQEKISTTSGAIGSTPRVRRSSLSLNSLRKLAHGVSYFDEPHLGDGGRVARDRRLG
jgi:hypothetical protein